ncbi:hypothetical protein JW752_04640 [Candidatus Peregrinibacteria bacterium]|nr:hypothetical protein [Candidatus Peregrinibacteria bacterium]
MANDQADNQTVNNNGVSLYHFSKNIFLLSLLFLLIFSAWYGMVRLDRQAFSFEKVSPELIFSANQEVQIRTPFDVAYVNPEPGQALMAGTAIRTGAQSFVEVKLDNNVVRLDQNTEVRLLESRFQSPADEPRLVFQLLSGSVWVNAFHPIAVRSDQAEACFGHGVGVYTYTEPLNRVMSIVGYADLTLFRPNGQTLSRFVIPLKSQVTFTDSQLIPDYARLEYSKLKKELKMTPVSQSILNEPWVQRNVKDDALIFLAENHYIFSSGSYRYNIFLSTLREDLTFIPYKKRLERLSRARFTLSYLLGGVHRDGDMEEAETLLSVFDSLVSEQEGDPALRDLMERQFYAIRNVETDTPAYAVKEDLRNHLFSKDAPVFLRTYLTDADFLMRIGETKQAESVSKDWLAQWKPGIRKAHSDEFSQQARIFHSLLLSYADDVSWPLLAILDEAGDYRLELAGNADETLFEIAMERLDMSKYLVAHYRYLDARNYLQTSYESLHLAQKETYAAAREIFLEDAALLADRIAFAQKTLRGAARPINEKDFADYLSVQERDKTLEERFLTFLEETRVQEEEAELPTLDNVSQRFTLARIVVLDEDIKPDPDFPFQFTIEEGRLLDRAKDGSPITFSARYDYTNNGVYNILLNDEPLKGNYALDDFVRIAIAGAAAKETTPEESIVNLVDFLNLTESEETERSQVTAQDLAVQLTINELAQFNIVVPSAQQVSVLNPVKLNEYRIVAAIIADPVTKRVLKVDFDYHSGTKMISNIRLVDLPIDFGGSALGAAEFIPSVFRVVVGQEKEAAVLKDVVSRLGQQKVTVDQNDLRLNAGQTQATFSKARVKSMPIEFSGVYDIGRNLLLTAQHPLLTAENAGISDYISDLALLFVIDYLKGKGITVYEENIVTALPADKVRIIDYVRGSKILDFTYDVTSNRLTDISLQGTDAHVDSMTFQEFSLLEGGEPPAEEVEEETAEEGIAEEETENMEMP